MQRIPEVDPASIDHRSASRLLLALAGRQKASIAWAVLTSSVWNTSQVVIPVALGRAIDQGITAGDTSALVTWSLVIVVLGLVRATTGTAFYRQSVVIRTVSGCMAVRLVTHQITALGASVVGRQDVGNLTATSTSDVAAIGNGMRHVGRVIGSVVAVVVITIVMFTISVPLGFLVLVIVPAVVGLSGLLLRPLHRHQDEYRSQQGRLAGRAVDIAAGLRVLRGIGGERRFAAAFRADSARLRSADVEVARAEANVSAAEVFMPGLIAAVVTYTAARFVLDDRVTIGQLVAFYAFAVFLTLPLHDIIEGANQLTRSLVAASRVTDLLNIAVPDRARPVEVDTPWPSGPLSDRSSGLSVPASTLLAVACADPSDADALASRLARFTESGTTMVGDTPLASLPLPLVRSRVLLARNSDRFFADTGRREIATSVSVTSEEASEALRVACATDIVDALPRGLDTEMTGRGRTFSGGQLQRLRLTRALAAGADVTLLVEPTNAVDAYTEHMIATNLADHHRSRAGGRSTVVFTVSPLMLQQAHRVAYVVEGRVVAEGTHAELLERHPRYRDLVTREETEAVRP